MDTIISKRHWLKFYVGLLAITLCIVLLAFAVFAVRTQANAPNGEVLLCILSALLLLAPLVIITYFVNVPNVTVTSEYIKINQKLYYWSDVEEVKLTGK